MTTTLHFRCDGRKASLLDGYNSSALKEAFSFSKPGARFSPQYKRWLQEKALNIPEDERSGWNGKESMVKNNTIDVGLLLGSEKDLAKAGFKAKITKWKNRPCIMPVHGFIEKDPKYEYQNDANTAMLHSIRNGGGLVLAGTGTGKTKIAAQFFSWIPGKCLFVVDQIDLLYQSQKEIQEWLTKEGYDTKVGIVGNSVFDPQRITVATIQTLSKHKNRSNFRKWTKNIEVIMIDEIHVQMSRRNFAVVTNIQPQAVIGLTATMQLKKKQVRFKCYSICGPMIFEFPLAKGVEAGVLSQGVVMQVPIAENHKIRKTKLVAIKDRYGCNTKAKEKQPVDDYMHQVVYNPNAHSMVTSLVKECISQDLCTVVLVERIKHLKRLDKRLAEHTPKLFFGEIEKDTRKKQLKTFDSGKDNLILATRVFTKGINLKRIDVVIDAAQRSNKNDCIQKYGRAARLHAEKAGILYFDLFTEGKLAKAAKSRKSAFKAAKIPIEILTPVDTAFGPKGIISRADKLLVATLKKNRK